MEKSHSFAVDDTAFQLRMSQLPPRESPALLYDIVMKD